MLARQPQPPERDGAPAPTEPTALEFARRFDQLQRGVILRKWSRRRRRADGDAAGAQDEPAGGRAAWEGCVRTRLFVMRLMADSDDAAAAGASDGGGGAPGAAGECALMWRRTGGFSNAGDAHFPNFEPAGDRDGNRSLALSSVVGTPARPTRWSPHRPSRGRPGR